jgi:hypothetical protein
MKKLWSLPLMFIALISFAQTKGTAKIYGYKQPVSQGAFPSKGIDEQGKEVGSEPEQRFNYFLFLSSATTLYPSEIWVNGQLFAVTARSVKSTPVRQTNANAETADSSRILVPKTSKKVWQLDLRPANSSIKASEKGKALAKTNELVVVYKMGGKFYYSNLPKLELLESVAMQ